MFIHVVDENMKLFFRNLFAWQENDLVFYITKFEKRFLNSTTDTQS